ncbi:hypothetical protein C1645_853641 [Glomus cerebriforme]|uniref:Galactose oxidase n=1 Tax=Glomus cerebriforme TaxID=658196 RepID=A0A397SY47_9GLOM|nr:hypothetical protein C1645_853641 [Glomus cerebriforme]
MSKSSLIYFILWILLQVLVEVNCQMSPKPSVLTRHTATFIDNKLYILGGRDLSDQLVGQEFFYLDFSAPFNTLSLLWQDLSYIDMLPQHANAASVKGGANNDTLFLYGGNNLTMALVYTFDPHSITWGIPKILGDSPIRTRGLTGVINNGKMYLWSGMDTLANYNFVNVMLILDTINLSWGKGSLVNSPTPRGYYGATLLPNNNIIYIGGYNDKTLTSDPKSLNIITGNALTLSEAYIYDTINDNWSTKITSGKIPSNRDGFSAILSLDGQRIIIYGGEFINPGYLDTTLYVLDLTNFNWYVPNISGSIPTPRAWHKANVIGKYMVISFGRGYDKSIESDILLLDISNNKEYIWTMTFDPTVPNNTTPPSSPSTSQLSSSQISSSQLSGTIVGSLFGGLLFSFGVFFLYKWNKNKQKQKDESNSEEITNPTKRNIHNYNQAINNDYNNHEQEIIQIPINENSTNHESVIPTPVIINKNYGQEIIQTPNIENTTIHEPIISASEINRNNNHEQEITLTFIDNKLQNFKDEMLQAVKQEINQSLNNSNIVRNERQG